MSKRDPSQDLEEVRRLWREWTDVFERFARRRPNRRKITQSEYRKLHEQLLQTCRLNFDQTAPERQPLFHHLETLAKPWVSLSAMEGTKQELLLELLARFEREERKLGGGWWRSFSRRINAPLVAAVVGIVILAAVFLLSGDQAGSRVADRIEGLFLSIWWGFKRLSLLTKFAIVTVIVVVLGIRFVSIPQR